MAVGARLWLAPSHCFHHGSAELGSFLFPRVGEGRDRKLKHAARKEPFSSGVCGPGAMWCCALDSRVRRAHDERCRQRLGTGRQDHHGSTPNVLQRGETQAQWLSKPPISS